MKNMHNLIATGSLKALPSEYRGCVFRSRLEARTAYYFDLLGIQWGYEPEGYALPCGNYAPDFFCTAVDKYDKEHRFFVEVKPNYDQFAQYEERLRELCQASKIDVYYFGGFHEVEPRKSYYSDLNLTNPAIGFVSYDPQPEMFDEPDPNQGKTPHTDRTSVIDAYFTYYAFRQKRWGCPHYSDCCASEEDIDCLDKARFLKFDKAGRAMVPGRRLKNYGIGIHAHCLHG
jgi:hypothetical protein